MSGDCLENMLFKFGVGSILALDISIMLSTTLTGPAMHKKIAHPHRLISNGNYIGLSAIHPVHLAAIS